jgi:16S rRNA processing protein RimM
MTSDGEPWGEIRVRPETDFPERFKDLREVCLALPDGCERLFHVRSARVTAKGVTLALAECRSRGEAESLREAWVKIKPSMAVPLDEGSYWVHQIVGLRVLTTEGDELGEVSEVLRSPANDVYVTPSRMIPAVREVVKEIDLENGRMVVSLPPDREADGRRGRQ